MISHEGPAVDHCHHSKRPDLVKQAALHIYSKQAYPEQNRTRTMTLQYPNTGAANDGSCSARATWARSNVCSPSLLHAELLPPPHPCLQRTQGHTRSNHTSVLGTDPLLDIRGRSWQSSNSLSSEDDPPTLLTSTCDLAGYGDGGTKAMCMGNLAPSHSWEAAGLLFLTILPSKLTNCRQGKPSIA